MDWRFAAHAILTIIIVIAIGADIVHTRLVLDSLSTAIERGKATAAAPLAETADGQPLLGIPAKVGCVQVSDGKGGFDIRFTAIREPVEGSSGGPTTSVTGVLNSTGKVDGRITSQAAGLSEVELPNPDTIRRVALACRRALIVAPAG